MRSGTIFSHASVLALALLIAGGAQGQNESSPSRYTFAVVHAFKGPPDGAFPWSGVVGAPDGNLYGSTWAGGSQPDCSGSLGVGCGTLYRIDASGKETVIASLPGLPGSLHLYGGLLPAKDGSLYGVTNQGGTSGACHNSCGTVFRLDARQKLKVLCSFGSRGGTGDANGPEGSLVRDGDGNFFGTSRYGGTNNNGTIFEVDRSGTETVVYRFTGGSDGAGPSPDLLRNKAGNLYGTAGGGGGACNCGIVFKLDPAGVLSVLYAFQGGTDGATPIRGVIADSTGNLYGTTSGGGDMACANGYGCGTVFRLAPDGTKTVLYTFTGSPDGELPDSPLAMDKAGNLFGVTYVGGDASCGELGCGAVYEVTSSGKERVIHAFTGGRDGALPWGGVYVDANGMLTGTAQEGGRSNTWCGAGCGVVYKLSPSN
jgi:uncharacterized repeat protein (TIGR03803 family)